MKFIAALLLSIINWKQVSPRGSTCQSFCCVSLIHLIVLLTPRVLIAQPQTLRAVCLSFQSGKIAVDSPGTPCTQQYSRTGATPQLCVDISTCLGLNPWCRIMECRTESMSSFEKGENAHRTLSVLQAVHLESRSISVIALLGKFLGHINLTCSCPWTCYYRGSLRFIGVSVLEF